MEMKIPSQRTDTDDLAELHTDSLVVCSICGAAVVDVGQHQKWHYRISAALTKSQSAC